MAQEKYNFLDVFTESPEGNLYPKITININGFVLNPGFTIIPDSKVGGINLHQYKYLPIAGEYIGDVLHIRGFFSGKSTESE